MEEIAKVMAIPTIEIMERLNRNPNVFQMEESVLLTTHNPYYNICVTTENNALTRL